MPGLPIDIHRHDVADTNGRQLLALHRLRRGVERRTAASVGALREPLMALKRAQLIRELQELIAALDRRAPQVERAGEAAIGREARALKHRATQRLAELERQSATAGAAS